MIIQPGGSGNLASLSEVTTGTSGATEAIHFPDRPCVIAEWARLLKPTGKLLFTDPITVTGALTNAEIAKRSSAGFYLFVPHGYDERISRMRLLVCEDVTANMAKVAEARHAARASRSTALREIEGGQTYDNEQEFLTVAARGAREGRLSRFLYVSEQVKPPIKPKGFPGPPHGK